MPDCEMRTTIPVDERIDFVTLALDGMGWLTQRELVTRMEHMVLVPNYTIEHLSYSLQKMCQRRVVCRRKREGTAAYEYRFGGEIG